MKIEQILQNHNIDKLNREQAIFTSIFVMQNRLQNAGEKIQNDLSMKQWLLLTIISVCQQQHSLSNIGRLMGCSRQNIKKLILTLEKKGYVKILKGRNNSVFVELTDKVDKYSKEIGQKQITFLKTLFQEFNDKQIEQLFNMFLKLYIGIEKVEKYVEENNEKEEGGK